MSTLDHIQSTADARLNAKRRLPWMMFDFIDGAAGDESAVGRNTDALKSIELLPRALVNIEGRSLAIPFLGKTWGLPFGIAPMGMCALSWPRADEAFADEARRHDFPHCLSTAASMSLEDLYQRVGDNAWFQLYVSNMDAACALVQRAEDAGYQYLMLTVDTPLISRRRREMRRGFKVPFKFGPSQIFDFAVHPRWSIATLLNGTPQFGNNQPTPTGSAKAFDRSQSRGGVDWDFLKRLRERWPHKLIVKGILSPEDAVRIRDTGVDAVYVSNHGGRQLESAPAAITRLPLIRAAVGDDYPVIFDSGLRGGEDIIKAYALGANFVMLGRPFLYAAGAAGAAGVARIVELIVEELHTTLAQIGRTEVASLDSSVLVK
tara:strand:+ start:236 stop:1363 length:1128 start_codon:yes stop_codon:yes gene_type:complete